MIEVLDFNLLVWMLFGLTAILLVKEEVMYRLYDTKVAYVNHQILHNTDNARRAVLLYEKYKIIFKSGAVNFLFFVLLFVGLSGYLQDRVIVMLYSWAVSWVWFYVLFTIFISLGMNLVKHQIRKLYIV